MANWDITTLAARLEYDTTLGTYVNSCAIDANHFINFWAGVDSDGFVQVFTVNTSTWAVTTANNSLEFDTQNGRYNSCLKVDSNHFINFWAGAAGIVGYVQIFTVNTSTWAVTTAATSLNFDTQAGTYHNCIQIDTNHFVNYWDGAGTNSNVQVFEVNTTTWAVTTANDLLVFDAAVGYFMSSCLIDENHMILFFGGVDGDGFVQTLVVNTTTWAVTTSSDTLEFDTQNGQQNSCYQVDSNHFINFWRGGAGQDGYAQIFTVNTTTWAVTTAASALCFDTQNNYGNSVQQIDSNHFINCWSGGATANVNAYVQIFEVDTSTWAITTAAGSLNFETTNSSYNSCNKFLFWFWF